MSTKWKLHEESTMLYQGIRTTKGSKESIVLYVINHDDEQMLEVIAYNEGTQVEAPRMYVDCM